MYCDWTWATYVPEPSTAVQTLDPFVLTWMQVVADARAGVVPAAAEARRQALRTAAPVIAVSLKRRPPENFISRKFPSGLSVADVRITQQARKSDKTVSLPT